MVAWGEKELVFINELSHGHLRVSDLLWGIKRVVGCVLADLEQCGRRFLFSFELHLFL